MKYLIVLTDGAADEPQTALGGKTPLEAANMPRANLLASLGTVGMVTTVPVGMAPGSDTANLSVMGFDPTLYHTGRSPLEAASMGIPMEMTDVAFRCNLVTLAGDGPYEELRMVDHSAGEISTQEARQLIETVQKAFGTETIHFYPGVSYRHAMILGNGTTDFELTPPHDILDQTIADHLPKDEKIRFIEEMMRESYGLLSEHPVNKNRIKRGLRPANSIWVWGQGKKPDLPSFHEKYHVKGATISAVDLINGIGVSAGLDVVRVPGATGTIHTNFDGKAAAAIQKFEEGTDFIYLHLEAPDECSHQGDLEGKIRSLELIDEKIIAPIADWLADRGGEYRILILPDHPTPLRIRTHTGDPVPFVLYDSRSETIPADPSKSFGEGSGRTGTIFPAGYLLAEYFFDIAKS